MSKSTQPDFQVFVTSLGQQLIFRCRKLRRDSFYHLFGGFYERQSEFARQSAAVKI